MAERRDNRFFVVVVRFNSNWRVDWSCERTLGPIDACLDLLGRLTTRRIFGCALSCFFGDVRFLTGGAADLDETGSVFRNLVLFVVGAFLVRVVLASE
jgi:hypothetical protein